MIVLAESVAENPTAAEQPRRFPGRERSLTAVASPIASFPDEPVRALVQQLFFRQDAPPVRHAGFAAADPGTDTAQLCLSVARILAEGGAHDIGLIDASPGSRLLQTLASACPMAALRRAGRWRPGFGWRHARVGWRMTIRTPYRREAFPASAT